MRNERGSEEVLVSLTIVGLAVVGLLIWLGGAQFFKLFTYDFRESTAFFFPAFIALIIGVVVALPTKKPGGFIGTFITLGIIAGIVFAVPGTYNRLNTYYNSSVQIEENSVARDFAERTPYEVARATSARALMNTTGEAVNTKSLADVGEHGEWNTLVIARGFAKGYESLQNGSFPLYGAASVNDVNFCKFNDNASLRFGGVLPHNNLKRAIYWNIPLNVSYVQEDAYAYCNNDNEPVIVVPLKQKKGFLYPVDIYYGVATYNGETGQLDVITDRDDINEIPGPVYPLSLAETQRVSLIASGSFSDYFFKRAGYETATTNSEILLREVDKTDSYYVTTLRPRGDSTSIVAVAEVGASRIEKGNYNPLVLNELPESNYRPGNTTLVDDIRSQYSHMPDMVHADTKVFEITAGSDGGWVASIGREQSVIYRAYITPGESKIVLKNSDGDVVGKTTKLQPREGTSDSGEIVVESNLTDMSNEELVELGSLILEELNSRSN